jgi:hypothetical protein
MYNIRGQHWVLQGDGCNWSVKTRDTAQNILLKIFTENVVVNAFTMCNGQDNALPNTHGTITATLIVQTSMPSIVLIAPNPTTLTNSTSGVSGGTGITSPSTTVPATLSLQTASGSPTEPLATSSRSAQVASETASITPTLTKPQIVGISVAAVGGGTLAVGSLILFACWRRRKRAGRDSDMLPFQLDPSNGAKYGHGFRGPTERRIPGPGGTSNGVAAKLPPRVPLRLETSAPNMFSRRSILQDIIGLAISPETNIPAAERRHSSKLLPEKPTLTLRVPPYPTRPVGGPSFSQQVQQPSALSRESTATQFEEDEDGVDTAVSGQVADENWARKSAAQILNNATGKWQTIKSANPNLAHSTFVVTGDNSNQWRPGQAPKANASSVVPDYYVKPLNLSRGVGSFSQPRRPEEYPRPDQQQLKLQQLQIPNQAARPITTTSSLYSARGSSLPPSEVGRNSNAPRTRRSYKQAGPYDMRESAGSLTSFETNDSIISPQDPEPRTAGTDLSPVVESPTGTSPVSYPKIPGRLSLATIRMVPPPAQPDFGVPSNLPPWRQAELAAQRERMGLAPLQANPAAPGQKLFQGQLGPAFTHQRQRSRDYIAPSAVYNSLPSQASSFQNQNENGTKNESQLRPGPRPRAALSPGDANQNLNPSITFSRTSSNISETSNASSSLLTKRRGEQKALALIGSLNSKGSEEEKRKQQAKSRWRVLKEGDKEKAKSPGWRPMLGSGDGGVGNVNGGGNRGGGGTMQFEQTDLPTTSGWVPRLTPTRRGGELFLSVQ